MNPMLNELLFLAMGMTGIFFAAALARFGKSWLYLSIVVNLLLVSVLGGKLILFFGMVTNIGNLFYACVFFSIYLLIEDHGKDAAYKSIWMGALFVLKFVLMTQLALAFTGLPEYRGFDTAMRTLFKNIPQVAIACIVAFIVTQYVNIWLFNWLRETTKGRHLWFRNITSVVVGQFVDSVIFFTIAFAQIVKPDAILQAIIGGFLIKVMLGVLSTPFLYLGRSQKPAKQPSGLTPSGSRSYLPSLVRPKRHRSR